LTSARRTAVLLALAATGALATPAHADRIRLTYRPVEARVSLAAPDEPTASPSARSEFLPERPLAHPLRTIAGLNRNGEDVFREPEALPYLLVGVAALASDRQTVKWFRAAGEGEEKSNFSKTFSTIGSGEVIVPAILLFYVAGGRERDTAKLWAAALGNATIWTQGMKLLTGKERPDRSDGAVIYHGPGNLSNDSFPSGHASAATASAIVLGHQYPQYKTVFYALAAAVGVARITGRNHWPSDVYWGAGVGYYAGRQAIRNKDAILRWRF